MFEEEVLETIKKYNLIQKDDKIVLAVSGGPDSMAMLNCLIKLKDRIHFGVVVAHINHGLRENATIDEKYVEEYCQNKNLPFFVLHADIKKEALSEKKGIEETGRKIRYTFFNDIMKKTNSNKIALAHNKNDRVETIIMNILRGTGLNGLKGIEYKNGMYIRPLLDFDREKIEEYCKQECLNPRHDESNDENEYTRNKIRNIAIPYIKKEFNPNIIDTMIRFSNIASEEHDWVEEIVEKEYNEIEILEEKDKIELDLKKFNEQREVVQKKILLHAICKIFGSSQNIEKVNIDDLVKMCNKNIGNKYLTPNKNTKVLIKDKKIIISKLK